MTIIREPNVDQYAEQPYLGIRVQTPMKGMFTVVAQLRKELSGWVKQNQINPAGAPFLRYHVIDMAGEMDIEVGFPIIAPLLGDERVKAGLLPAGRYANLVYTGHGLTGNKTLLVWIKEQGLTLDRWEDPRGDAFRARYERYLTDPAVEPRKTKWEIELAMKLADQ